MKGVTTVLALMGLSMSGCAAAEAEHEAAAEAEHQAAPEAEEIGVQTTPTLGSIPEAPPLAEILRGPVSTPFTVAPAVLNREEVDRAREREFSSHLRAAGVAGTAHIWLLVDDEGQVLSRLVDRSSGNEDLDVVALRVAGIFRFSPALNDDEPVHVWVSVPIRFDGS